MAEAIYERTPNGVFKQVETIVNEVRKAAALNKLQLSSEYHVRVTKPDLSNIYSVVIEIKGFLLEKY